LFGRSWALPFGIAPTGYGGMFWPRGDHEHFAAARAAKIPFVLSGASVAGIEEVARAGADGLWFQLYPARERRVTDDIIARAAAAGIETLVVTVDLPVAAKRERDIRNGFGLDMRLDARRLVDVLSHPRWTWDWLAGGGLPVMTTWARYAPAGASAKEVAAFLDAQVYAPQTWADLERTRALWKGRLVVKGVQHPDDARRALRLGCDGIIVSNHGGRQLDRGPTPLETLPGVRAAVGRSVAVMLDGGVRRGGDVAAALCLGADFVFLGRASLYGLAAGGRAGVARAIAILADELSRVMAQIGRVATAELGPDALWPAAGPAGAATASASSAPSR